VSVSFDKLVPGMVLLDIHSSRMGNTMLRRLGLWKVKVISVDHVTRTAMCSWNGNTPTRYFEHEFKKLYLKRTKAYLKQEEASRARGGRMI
jgi:hypothetical protein